MTKATPCTCRGYDPADPCMHGDTSEGCPRHDFKPVPVPVTIAELAQLNPACPPSDVAGVRWDTGYQCVRHAIEGAHAAAENLTADAGRTGEVIYLAELDAGEVQLDSGCAECQVRPVLAVCEAEWAEALIAARELHSAGQSSRRDAVEAIARDEAWIDVPRHVRRLAVAILRGHTTGEWDILPGSGRVPAPPAPPHGCVTADDVLDIIQRVLAGVLCHQDADEISPETVSALTRSVAHLTAARSMLATQTTEAGR